MSTHKIARLCMMFCTLCILMPPGTGFGQMSASGSGASTMSLISNFTDCLTVSCFHLTAKAPLVAAQIYSTNDHTLAVDTNGQGYSYNDYGQSPANTWTAHPEWGVVYGLGTAADGSIWGLYGTCPGGGSGHNLGKWNSTTSQWILATYCFETFAMSPDQGSTMLLMTDVNGTLWSGDTVTGSWQHVANAPFPVMQAALINGSIGSYLAVKTDNSIWECTSSGCTQMPNLAVQVAADASGTSFYKLGTDQHIYHWNGTGWDQLYNTTATMIADGGPTNVWAIGSTSQNTNLWRFSEQGWQHTRAISGQVNCNVPQNEYQLLCANVVHTVTVQAGIGENFGAQYKYTFNGPSSFSGQASVDQNDIFYCIETPSGCQPATKSQVECAEVGAIFTDVALSIFAWEIAYSSFSEDGFVVNTSRWGPPMIYHLEDDCNDLEPPYPDLSVATHSMERYFDDAIGIQSWDMSAFCFSFSGGHDPWRCIMPPHVRARYPIKEGVAGCTTNP
jgi:hypothetical protein